MKNSLTKTFIRISICTFFIYLPFLSVAQKGNENLFEFKNENEVVLKIEHSNKYRKIKNNKLNKTVQLVTIANIAKLAKNNNGALPINLPGSNKVLVAKPTDIEYISEENYIWKGSFKKEEGYVTLICKNNEIFGNIQVGNKFYEIQSFEPGVSIIVEYNEDELSKLTCGNTHIDKPAVAKDASSENLIKPAKSTVSISEVRVLVLYTDAANSVVANIFNTATLAISQMNDALINSAVYSYLYMTLAGVESLDFTENPSDIRIDADNLSTNATANNLRDTYEADIVILLTDGNYTDAYGVVDEIGPINADAYAIVEADFATTSQYTFAHEACHLFGGRHDVDATGTYEHGYVFKTGPWPFRTDRYTIMAIFPPNGRILNYSNPDVNYLDKATGTTSSNNVARKLRNAAATVAAFRGYSPPPPLSATITGPTRGYNSGTYTWSANVTNGTSPYTYLYLWEYSLDGYNYTGTLGTSSSVTASLPYDNNLYLKLTVTSSDNQNAIDFHTTVNLGNEGEPPLTKSSAIASTDVDAIPEKTLQLNDNADLLLSSNVTIFPNPVSETTTISYFVNNKGLVIVEILNTVGNKVETLVNKTQSKGQQSITFNSKKLKSGIYYCKVTIEGKSTLNKLIIH